MKTFSTLLALCAGNSPVTGEFPSQRPATRSFDVFFDLRLNKPLSEQSWGCWFEMPSRSLWLHCNEFQSIHCSLLWGVAVSITWWRHQMETFFRVTGHLCGDSPVPDEFPAQRPVTQSFNVFFDLHPNKRLSKQWWGWWFETPPCPLPRLRNDMGPETSYPRSL